MTGGRGKVGGSAPSLTTIRLRACGNHRRQENEAMRVLLIEDHKPLARTLRQGLEEEGFAVDVAHDGQEGDFKARSADYDVIILDLMLPKEDGMSLLGRWRKDGL